MSTGLLVEPQDRVSLCVRDLRVRLNDKDRRPQKNRSKGKDTVEVDVEAAPKKQILSGLSLDLSAGKVLAVLGGSGSGKTTLLNTLASRMTFRKSNNPFAFEGMVQFFPQNPIVSYMIQEDAFSPGLTVLETLQFTAKMRLPQSSTQERQDLVGFILESLGLSKVKHSLVCNFQFKSTLSGGERRRVSLAIQLLTKPQVLFLDEPTTGLDSNTSITLINTVKQLAGDFGITVVVTIHQPRFEILSAVDEICVLAKGGNMIFAGELSAGYTYFEQFTGEGDEVDSNFADFLLRISSVDKTDSLEIEALTQKRVTKLIDNWKSTQPLKPVEFTDTFSSGNPIINGTHIARLPLHREAMVIFLRTMLLTRRDMESMIMMHLTMVILSITAGWIFYKPGNSLAGIRSVTSSLYVCCELIGFAPMVYEIQRLCMGDGRALLRESKEGMYTIQSWFIGRRIAKMLVEDIPLSLVWSIITYYMWGLQSSSNFGIYFINNLLIYMTSIAVGHFCFVAGGFQFSTAGLVSMLYYQLQNSACGYFVNAKTMPVYVRWTKYISNFWYSFGSLASNQFSDFMGDCPYDTADACFEYTGTATLENLGFPKNWRVAPLMAGTAFFLGFYIVSAIWIWYETRRDNIKVVKERTSKHDLLNLLKPKETVDLSELKSSDDQITVSLHGIFLSLKPSLLKNKLFRRPFTNKNLLDDVSTSFKPGVNAIMGPSGSGKTTLLNMLTGRTGSNIAISGSMQLNGQSIPLSLLPKIVSYVVQDDSILIPSLTVRETLHYQAKLRLDPPKHANIPQIVTDLMRKMGLGDVANVPIGSEAIKGISGGEKRRVSIAIQLLNSSRILLLDEPTSGLDSFTSSSIVGLLDDLAKSEAKTIIMTIHQPKQELFEKFGSVLLLGDGHVLYEGRPRSLVEYFGKLGFQPDYEMNFADFVLDVVNDRLVDNNGLATMEKLINEWRDHHAAVNLMKDSICNQSFDHLIHKRPSFVETFPPILSRQFTVLMRSADVIFCRLIQPCAVAVVHALYFSPLRHDSQSISNRLGLIQEVLNMYFAGFLNNMALYPTEKFTFYQEYQEGVYSTMTFMLAYLLNEIPFEIVSSFVFSIFVVLVIGLPRTAGMFFTMFYLACAVLNCGESIGMFFNTVLDHMGIATNVLSNVLTIGLFMGGTMALNMPGFFKALNYLSPLRYAVLATAELVFEGQAFECIGGGTDCVLSTGEAVMEQYHLKSNFSVNMGAVAVVVVVYRLIAIATLELKVRYLRTP